MKQAAQNKILMLHKVNCQEKSNTVLYFTIALHHRKDKKLDMKKGKGYNLFLSEYSQADLSGP